MKTLYCPNCGHVEFIGNHGKVAKVRCFECGSFVMKNLRLPTITKVWLTKQLAKKEDTNGTNSSRSKPAV